MFRRSVAFLLLGLLAGCTKRVPTLPPCSSSVQYAYNPEGLTTIAVAFPDDFLTVDNPDSLTGLQVNVTPQNAEWTQLNVPSELGGTFPELDTLDGWGTQAAIVFRLNGPLGTPPSGVPQSLQTDVLQLWEVSDNPHRVPYTTSLTDNDETIVIQPMVPLAPETLHAVFMQRVEPTDAGEPVCPSSVLQQLLLGTASSPALQRVQPEYAKALKASGVDPATVGGAVVFTTQSISEQSLAIEQDIAGRTFTWLSKPTCTPEPQAQYNVCYGTFQANDYRNDAGVVEGTTPVSSYVLTPQIWLPLNAPKPWPLMIFGHGLGGDTAEGDPLGTLLAPMGVAAIAIDAVDFGVHPGAPSGQLPQILAFFGLNGSFSPLVLRDNFRQSTYDKLQLLQLILQDGDLDGDGQPDVVTSEMSYYGASLGGIMGPEFLAVEDRLNLAVLSVPGARVSSIVQFAPDFSFLPDIFLGNNNTQGDIDRFFPILQAAIDRGDSGNYATHVMTNRYSQADSQNPSVMFNMVLDDSTVGNVSNAALAEAMNIPELGQVLVPIPIIPLLGGTSVQGNMDNGTRTAGLFEYDRISETADGGLETATHSNVSASYQALYQTQQLVRSWLDGGVPDIINPYIVLDTPELPPDAG